MMNKFENNLEMQILDFATDKRSEWEKNHKLYSVVFELTPNCNFNCVHCYLCNHHSSKELSFSEIVEILDILYDKGVLFVTFTGGDIFTRSDFLQIYLYAKKKGFIIELYTNGALIDDNIIKVLQKYPPLLVDISLYGANENTYKKVTGVSGAYKKVINAIDKLIKSGIRVSLKAPILNLYLDELDEMKKIATDRGIAFRAGFEISPSIDNDNSIQKYQVDDYDGLKYEFTEYKDRPKKWLDSDWLSNNGVMLVNLKRDKPLFRCKLGRSSCVIDYEGKLCPCMSFKHVGVKITKDNFDETWNSFRVYQDFKAHDDYKCLSCKAYDLCDICPAMMDFVHNNMEYVDEHFCRIAKARYEFYIEQKPIEHILHNLKNIN